MKLYASLVLAATVIVPLAALSVWSWLARMVRRRRAAHLWPFVAFLFLAGCEAPAPPMQQEDAGAMHDSGSDAAEESDVTEAGVDASTHVCVTVKDCPSLQAKACYDVFCDPSGKRTDPESSVAGCYVDSASFGSICFDMISATLVCTGTCMPPDGGGPPWVCEPIFPPCVDGG